MVRGKKKISLMPIKEKNYLLSYNKIYNSKCKKQALRNETTDYRSQKYT